MNNFWTWLLLANSLMVSSQHSLPSPADGSDVMLAAVSRGHHTVLGMVPDEKIAKGTTFVEPLARLTPSGQWRSLPCFADTDGKHYLDQNACLKFEQEYLSKPHTYIVVSADGRGATIEAAPTKLDECFGYTGTGAYSGGQIQMSTIAATSVDFFADSPAPQVLSDAATKPVLKAFASAVPGGLDSTLDLKVFSLQLENHDLVLVQRSYVEKAGKPLMLIFAIGEMNQGHFQLLQWKQNTGDQDEIALGTVHLKNGRDFLITSTVDPEGQWFRVYGIRDGKLVMIYSGGGSSC
jgi:hypothetical protein